MGPDQSKDVRMEHDLLGEREVPVDGTGDPYAARAGEFREIANGALLDQFVVDVIQGGAGTSTSMNANGVIANRALEIGGRAKRDYAYLHPIEHAC